MSFWWARDLPCSPAFTPCLAQNPVPSCPVWPIMAGNKWKDQKALTSQVRGQSEEKGAEQGKILDLTILPSSIYWGQVEIPQRSLPHSCKNQLALICIIYNFNNLVGGMNWLIKCYLESLFIKASLHKSLALLAHFMLLGLVSVMREEIILLNDRPRSFQKL